MAGSNPNTSTTCQLWSPNWSKEGLLGLFATLELVLAVLRACMCIVDQAAMATWRSHSGAMMTPAYQMGGRSCLLSESLYVCRASRQAVAEARHCKMLLLQRHAVARYCCCEAWYGNMMLSQRHAGATCCCCSGMLLQDAAVAEACWCGGILVEGIAGSVMLTVD